MVLFSGLWLVKSSARPRAALELQGSGLCPGRLSAVKPGALPSAGHACGLALVWPCPPLGQPVLWAQLPDVAWMGEPARVSSFVEGLGSMWLHLGRGRRWVRAFVVLSHPSSPVVKGGLWWIFGSKVERKASYSPHIPLFCH